MDSALANAQATQAALDAAPFHAPPIPAPSARAVVPSGSPSLREGAGGRVLPSASDSCLSDSPPDLAADVAELADAPVDPNARTLPELAQEIVRRPPLLDPGWLWLFAGLTLVCFTLVIPAQRDLEEARFYRDRVHAAEDHRQARLARYQNYLDALERGDETLVLSLAAMQLNKAPKGTDLLVQGSEIAKRSASVFTNLEPPPLQLPQRSQRPMSLLEKWTSDDHSRLWLLGGGSLMILIGLLPTSTRRS
ncbi:MAG: hypothetical protein ACREJO_03290 [Phycisphaerales bacterium]